jgi:hypothetical protein
MLWQIFPDFQGLAFTDTSPIMFPTRSSRPALGTNPLSLAAPGTNGDSFVLDMATTTVAVGKVQSQSTLKSRHNNSDEQNLLAFSIFVVLSNSINSTLIRLNYLNVELCVRLKTELIVQIEIASRKEQAVPDSWGVDAAGIVSKDPKRILGGGGLLPLGGTEIGGGKYSLPPLFKSKRIFHFQAATRAPVSQQW